MNSLRDHVIKRASLRQAARPMTSDDAHDILVLYGDRVQEALEHHQAVANDTTKKVKDITKAWQENDTHALYMLGVLAPNLARDIEQAWKILEQ